MRHHCERELALLVAVALGLLPELWPCVSNIYGKLWGSYDLLSSI